MARQARLVVPGQVHHLVQKGNRDQTVFFENADYLEYLSLITKKTAAAGTELVAYCMLKSQVHLLVIPQSLDGLRCVGEAHRLYARYANRKMGWTGYLWAGRFSSYPMAEAHVLNAIRYVELLPVRAGLVDWPELYAYSSAPLRLKGWTSKSIRASAPSDWSNFWAEGLLAANTAPSVFEQHIRISRALG